MSIEALCAYCHNWFDSNEPKYFGTFTISGGELQGFSGKLKNGQYIRIIGSTFNDGVYKYPVTELTDECFTGAVWGMAIPKAFIDLADEVVAWQDENGKAVTSPYQSESFHSYSRTLKVSGGTTAESDKTTWQGAFASQLARWKKVRL